MLVGEVLQADLGVYAKGGIEIKDFTIGELKEIQNATWIPNSIRNYTHDWDKVSAQLDRASADVERLVMQFVNNLMSTGANFLSQVAMFLLYSLFGLLQPVGKNSLWQNVYLVVQTYIMLKSFCNFVFAICVYTLLVALSVQFALMISLLAFCVSFIPEIGAFVAGGLPLPLIMLNAADDVHSRAWKLLFCCTGMFAAKTLCANILETKLMGQNEILAGKVNERCKKEAEETHPVIVLFVLFVSAEVWGISGMLFAVPLISLVRMVINIHSSLEQENMDADKSC